MVATYYRDDFSGKSHNAYWAEKQESKYPMTHAKRLLANAIGCTQREAQAVLEHSWHGEWHHVGKYATECRYYCYQRAIVYLSLINPASLGIYFRKPDIAKIRNLAAEIIETHDDPDSVIYDALSRRAYNRTVGVTLAG